MGGDQRGARRCAFTGQNNGSAGGLCLDARKQEASRSLHRVAWLSVFFRDGERQGFGIDQCDGIARTVGNGHGKAKLSHRHGERLVARKAVIQHCRMVSPIVGGVEGDGDQGHAVSLRRADQRASRLFGKARFHADGALIGAQQLVVIEQQAQVGGSVVGDGMAGRGYDLAQQRNRQHLGGDGRQLSRGGVMLLVV